VFERRCLSPRYPTTEARELNAGGGHGDNEKAKVGRLSVVAFLVAWSAVGVLAYAKDKRSVSPDDPTYRLFQLLAAMKAGKWCCSTPQRG